MPKTDRICPSNLRGQMHKIACTNSARIGHGFVKMFDEGKCRKWQSFPLEKAFDNIFDDIKL